MATKMQIEEFIMRANISESRRKALIKRLGGVSHDDNENLSEEQISRIFEGVSDLQKEFAKAITGSS